MKARPDFNRLSKKYDRSNFVRFLEDFPDQCREAWKSSQASSIRQPASPIQNVVVTGLGGSAIAAEVLRNYLDGECSFPLMINRDYQLPGYVGRESLVIASSYSGDTEETLAAYQDAIRRGAWPVVLTTGGKLQEMAEQVKGDLIRMPPGLPPRQAFGYSFFMLLKFFQGKGWIADQSQAVAAAVFELEKLRKANSLNAKKSFTSELAVTLHGKIPFIYGSPRTTEAVALRWKQQFAENAKIHAFVNVLPEMNHNEIMGWGNQKELLKKSVVIFLEDPDDPPRIRTRQEITKKILGGLGIQIRSVASNAKERLSRLLGLVYLGDWTSYYLALLQKADPIVINRIDYLKAQLTKK